MFAVGMVISKYKVQEPGSWWNIKFEEEDEEEAAGGHEKVQKKNSLNTVLDDDQTNRSESADQINSSRALKGG